MDLDRITTIETGVLLKYGRTPGLLTDGDRATFGKAVARKFGRFPFPDDLPRALVRWRDHVVSKHDKENSPEGTLYIAMRWTFACRSLMPGTLTQSM